MNPYAIFSIKLATQLIRMGFSTVGTAINNKCPTHLVFYFEDTAELRQAVKDFTN
jgi:hypothetical protein